jgi:hypothetical protein
MRVFDDRFLCEFGPWMLRALTMLAVLLAGVA